MRENTAAKQSQRTAAEARWVSSLLAAELVPREAGTQRARGLSAFSKSAPEMRYFLGVIQHVCTQIDTEIFIGRFKYRHVCVRTDVRVFTYVLHLD